MPRSKRGEPRFPIAVDDALLDEDLVHATPAGRAAITAMIGRLQQDGVSQSWLKRCQADGHDATALEGCVKLYIPQPNGQWGAVFAGDRRGGIPTLVLVAAGDRHPARPWTPSVYQVAHRRLHANEESSPSNT